MTTVDAAGDDLAAHDHHDHGEFIAHHFESAEQQFDSGKLGIWVFLLTEILFFSGLFCAYVLYRYHHPEIFVQAHHFLDKFLGMGNTVVLLFSSLTMALAVRSSQLGRNKNVAWMVLITMVCAAIFLGVKAVEYSHKWDMGIFVRAYFQNPPVEHHSAGISNYLIWLSVIPLILLVVFGAMGALYKVTNKPMLATFFAGMTIMIGGYFLGAAGGYVYQNYIIAKVSHEETAHNVAAEHAAATDHSDSGETAAGGEHAADDHAHGSTEKLHHDIGIFFSIYYCMTGLHAFHIIGGIIALAWIFYRSLANHWRSDYFGPVDNVGLYWHLVDLIWIFLFPLLYLIN